MLGVVLWMLAEAWGASGAGPFVPSMMELWGRACDAGYVCENAEHVCENAEALDGATGGSTQKSKSIKLADCSCAPACCDGVAVRAVPPE